MKRLLVLVALAACTSSPSPTPLAQLHSAYGNTTLELVAKGELDILLRVSKLDSADCPTLAEDVTAQFDGEAMRVYRGGADTVAGGCYPIAFQFDNMPMSSITAWERTTSGSQLVLHDRSATWNIQTGNLFADDFVIDAAQSRVVWRDVAQITTAQIQPQESFTIDHNAIVYPAGAPPTYVDATAHPTTSRCDGPSVCTIDLEGARALGPINP